MLHLAAAGAVRLANQSRNLALQAAVIALPALRAALALGEVAGCLVEANHQLVRIFVFFAGDNVSHAIK